MSYLVQMDIGNGCAVDITGQKSSYSVIVSSGAFSFSLLPGEARELAGALHRLARLGQPFPIPFMFGPETVFITPFCEAGQLSVLDITGSGFGLKIPVGCVLILVDHLIAAADVVEAAVAPEERAANKAPAFLPAIYTGGRYDNDI